MHVINTVSCHFIGSLICICPVSRCSFILCDVANFTTSQWKIESTASGPFLSDAVTYMYIVGKYKIHDHSLWHRTEKLASLPASKACTNKLYIFWQSMYIVYFYFQSLYKKHVFENFLTYHHLGNNHLTFGLGVGSGYAPLQ